MAARDIPHLTVDRGRTGSGSAADDLLEAIDSSAAYALEGGRVERSYLVAGRCVRFLFAGPALVEQLTRALGHLPECADLPAELTLIAWDSASTGSAGPPLPPDPDPDGPAWRRVLVDEQPLHAVFKPGPRTFSVVDRASARAWYWCADAATVPVWEQGTPFLHILHNWLSSIGMQLVHAGAAGDDTGGVLFVGKSGSGKSTATLSCVQAGMLYAGDDYVAVTGDPEPTVHAIYSSGKLDHHQVDRFPELAGWVVNPHGDRDEKRVFFLAEHAPARVARSFPLLSVLLPRVAGRPDTAIVSSTSAAALAALAPSTIFQMPGASGPELSSLAALLRQLTANVLESGTDLSGLAEAVRQLVAREGRER